VDDPPAPLAWDAEDVFSMMRCVRDLMIASFVGVDVVHVAITASSTVECKDDDVDWNDESLELIFRERLGEKENPWQLRKLFFDRRVTNNDNFIVCCGLN